MQPCLSIATARALRERATTFDMPHRDTELRSATAAGGRCSRLTEVVIVDSSCDRYGGFVAEAQIDRIGLHFCIDGRSALRLSSRFRADYWIISADLPDMSGLDLLDMLVPLVLKSECDPLPAGSHTSLAQGNETARSGVFIVSDTYRLEDEQRALGGGAAGYLVGPIADDVIKALRDRPGLRRTLCTLTAGPVAS